MRRLYSQISGEKERRGSDPARFLSIKLGIPSLDDFLWEHCGSIRPSDADFTYTYPYTVHKLQNLSCKINNLQKTPRMSAILTVAGSR